jgi:hypothetical protein
MAKRQVATIDAQKNTLIKIGAHYIDPTDVAAIVLASKEKKLYVIRLKSHPNPEYPLWVSAKELEHSPLLQAFNIVSEDE